MLVLGLGDGFKDQEIMKMKVLGVSNDEIGFYYTNLKREKSIKLLKVYVPHIWPKNGHNYCHMFSYDFPMIFLWTCRRQRLPCPQACSNVSQDRLQSVC